MNEYPIKTIRDKEEKLHRPEVRKNRQLLDGLLHPEFTEIGRSGRIYSRDDVLNEFATNDDFPKICSEHYRLQLLTEDLGLLTYRTSHMDVSGNKTRHSLRSSIWQLVDGDWKLRFHQGTPTDEPDSVVSYTKR